MLATNINWDLEGYKEIILPTEIEVPNDMTEDETSDYLSDMTGFCHKGFVLEP